MQKAGGGGGGGGGGESRRRKLRITVGPVVTAMNLGTNYGVGKEKSAMFLASLFCTEHFLRLYSIAQWISLH